MKCSMPGFPVLHYLPEFAQTHVHWVSDAIQPSHPLSPNSPPAFNLAQHQHLFPWVSSLHQVAKILEFQLQISPLNEYSGLISFRIDWFDLAVQGTLKSLLQYHSLKVKAVTNLDSELKSRDTTLLTKVCIVKAMVFPILMYRCASWAIYKYLDFRGTRLNLFEKKCNITFYSDANLLSTSACQHQSGESVSSLVFLHSSLTVAPIAFWVCVCEEDLGSRVKMGMFLTQSWAVISKDRETGQISCLLQQQSPSPQWLFQTEIARVFWPPPRGWSGWDEEGRSLFWVNRAHMHHAACGYLQAPCT